MKIPKNIKLGPGLTLNVWTVGGIVFLMILLLLMAIGQ